MDGREDPDMWEKAGNGEAGECSSARNSRLSQFNVVVDNDMTVQGRST